MTPTPVALEAIEGIIAELDGNIPKVMVSSIRSLLQHQKELEVENSKLRERVKEMGEEYRRENDRAIYLEGKLSKAKTDDQDHEQVRLYAERVDGENDTLEEEVKHLNEKFAFISEDLEEAQDRMEKAEQQNAAMREALEFYAANDNWITYNTSAGSIITMDRGLLARKALQLPTQTPPLADNALKSDMGKESKPFSIIFFPNDNCAVCDQFGNQMPEFQGDHRKSICALKDKGIDWRTIPNLKGYPNL